MIECFILLLSLILIAYATYKTNGGDVMSPPFLACLSFIVSCIAAIYNCHAWKTSISLITVFTILLGLLCFVIPASVFCRNASQNHSAESLRECGPIRIPKLLTAAVFLFGIVASGLYIKAILSTVDFSGGDWSLAMQKYRTLASYGEYKSVALPSYISYMFKLLTAFAYAYLFIFIYESFIEKRICFEHLLIPVLYCCASLVQASRGQIIIFVFAGVVMYWILRKWFCGNILRMNLTTVIVVIVILICGFTLFTMAGSLVGRTTVKTPLDSLACYVGGSIIGLDMFLQDPTAATSPENLFGAETFRGIYAFLSNRLGIPEWDYSFQMEYRVVNGINIGNLYTAFRYYLHDFGYLGMIVLTALQGAFFGFFYKVLMHHEKIKSLASFASLIIVFAYLYIAVAYLPLADYLFHQYLNPTTMLSLAMFVFAIVVLCKANDWLWSANKR